MVLEIADPFVAPAPPRSPWNSEVPADYSAMWIGSTECVKRIQQKISGDERVPWLQYVMNTYMAPALGRAETRRPRESYRCLLLGSNEGHMERTLAENGFRGEIVATDIAEKALARARQKSDALGLTHIRHVQMDLNRDSIEGPFDFVIAEGVLHHLVNVERCLRQVDSALRDDGVFVMVEFEGAVRFQLPDLQLRWINAALNVLPKALRPFPGDGEPEFPATAEENARVYQPRPPEQAIVEVDPSEAINGPLLKALVPEIFDIVERKGFGGTLLAYMTAHFDFKRANHDPFALNWLKVLLDVEDTLIRTRILDDDFVFYVVKRPSRDAGRRIILGPRLADRPPAVPPKRSAKTSWLPIPPDELIGLIAGHTDRNAFAVSRVWSVDKLLEQLATAGVSSSDFRTVLDFGCGCGRVLSGWVLKGTPHDLYGCDVNERLVSWCAQNLPAKCRVIAPEPPTPYESDFFDLVYGVSVFTHLGLRSQRAWVAELHRIVRPGGYVYMSFHGPAFYDRFFAHVRDGEARFRREGHLIMNEHREGANECATLHDVEFFKKLFEPFEFVKHIEGPTHIASEQDACIFRKSPVS